MKQFTAGTNDDGLRLDRFISKLLPHLPPSLIQRLLRQNKVRLNGKHQSCAARVRTGDSITLFFRPELLIPPSAECAYQLIGAPSLEIVYEDGHVLVVNKPSGMSAHQDTHGGVDTLITHIQAYLYQTGAWRPESENSFKPALCHRIDRNTSGLVMAAKTHEALVVLCEKLRLREIGKYYLCAAHGALQPESGTFKDYITRKPEQSVVSVSAKPSPEGRTAVTHYRTIARRGTSSGVLSLLECRLETGRTHQIRAQLAFHGHPLLGDGKYGKLSPGEPRRQMLCAYKLVFGTMPEGALHGLSGKTIELDSAPFESDFYSVSVF